jgi:hypothetical protein
MFSCDWRTFAVKARKIYNLLNLEICYGENSSNLLLSTFFFCVRVLICVTCAGKYAWNRHSSVFLVPLKCECQCGYQIALSLFTVFHFTVLILYLNFLPTVPSTYFQLLEIAEKFRKISVDLSIFTKIDNIVWFFLPVLWSSFLSDKFIC